MILRADLADRPSYPGHPAHCSCTPCNLTRYGDVEGLLQPGGPGQTRYGLDVILRAGNRTMVSTYYGAESSIDAVVSELLPRAQANAAERGEEVVETFICMMEPWTRVTALDMHGRPLPDLGVPAAPVVAEGDRLAVTPAMTAAAETALRELDPDEANWPTGDQVAAILLAGLATVTRTPQ